MSGGLAPSKSTVYVGNLPFSLTNNDVHKVFSKFGNIVKVTILRDKKTRESKGVAFIQYLERESAINACKSVDQKTLFERKIKCVIAQDNGRAAEFIKKKEYPDKTTCYECGDEGHLSYKCPKNLLGDREPPPKKEKKRKKDREIEKERSKKLIHDYYDDDDDLSDKKTLEIQQEGEGDEQGEDLFESSLSYVIALEASNSENKTATPHGESSVPRKKIKQSSYFSDEEEVDDDT